MDKARALSVVNPTLGLVLALQAATGFFRHLLPRGLFGPVHEGGAYALLLLAATHVWLNWSWFKARYFSPAPAR